MRRGVHRIMLASILPALAFWGLSQMFVNTAAHRNLNFADERIFLDHFHKEASSISPGSCLMERDNQTFPIPQTPTFISAGAQKTGSSSLFTYFSSHPRIVTSIETENHFFDRGILPVLSETYNLSESEQFCKVQEQYYEHWPSHHLLKTKKQQQQQQQQQFSFEKTPSYLHSFNAPVYLKKTCPWIPKVVITLRDPVDRAYSQYLMSKKKGYNLTFEDAIIKEMQILGDYRNNLTTIGDESSRLPSLEKITSARRSQDWQAKIFGINTTKKYPDSFLRKGIYAPQLRRWFQEYPRDSIMVVDYQDLKRNTSEVYYRLLDWVGIPHDVKRKDHFRPRHVHQATAEHLSHGTRAYLQSFFAPFNAELEEILGEKWRGVWTSDWNR